jgi:hypothetical protein
MDATNNAVLALADLKDYHCRVWSYLASHSALLVRAYKEDFQTDDTWYLLFSGVVYFEGPITWVVVDFNFGSPNESLGLIRKSGAFGDMPDDYLLKHYHLFKIKTGNGEVKILASNISRGNEIPGDFPWLTSVVNPQ